MLHREFKCFLKNGGLDDNDLLYYCDVRWLSKGDMSQRFYRLVPDIKEFFKQHKLIDQFAKLSDDNWLIQLAFVVFILK